MAWRYAKAGQEMDRPTSEGGICIQGPLTVEDWKKILDGIVDEIVEQAQREAREEARRE
jgi:hypothetical protein